MLLISRPRSSLLKASLPLRQILSSSQPATPAAQTLSLNTPRPTTTAHQPLQRNHPSSHTISPKPNETSTSSKLIAIQFTYTTAVAHLLRSPNHHQTTYNTSQYNSVVIPECAIALSSEPQQGNHTYKQNYPSRHNNNHYRRRPPAGENSAISKTLKPKLLTRTRTNTKPKLARSQKHS